ncbi:TraC family protein [Desulfurivibrio sp. D14AmB]|uniref:TraC family protein n=1 Tax=Desulfurivibrio sp. D14AmB TaxID=3374370 RepID=UPI00376EF2E5
MEQLTYRHPFSNFLNFEVYDPDTESYRNQDNTTGLLWECKPVAFLGDKGLNTLEGLFRAGLPEGSVLQFIFHADPHIEPILDGYQASRVRDNPLIENNTQAVRDFILAGKEGVKSCGDIPLRNFRLLVSVKIPTKLRDGLILEIKRQINETLFAAQLQPRHMPPGALLEWCRRLINLYPLDYPDQNFAQYDEMLPLRKQVINADTPIKDHGDHLLIGKNHFLCATPRVFPKKVDPLQTNTLVGGIKGLVSDADQIKTPFMYVVNVIFEPLATKLHAKCNLILSQQGVGSLSPSLKRKQEEHLAAADDLERGVQFVKVMPICWAWSSNLERARDSLARVRRLWENNNYVMQQESHILKVLFLASLPFGLYNNDKNLQSIDRDFIVPAPTVTALLPVQGDYPGAGSPVLLFLGRKGQLAGLNFYDSGASNQNIFCCASSGGGKSFAVNFIAFNYFATGALIRIIDIGGSYKKMSTMLGARYLDFNPEIDICLNPFTHIQDAEEELKSVVAVFAQMAYSNSDTDKPDDTEMNLLRNAVRWAWNRRNNQADSNTVYEFLTRFPAVDDAGLTDIGDNQQLVETARKLAFNIREFTSHGAHARFFVGPSNFDIRSDEFVVLELENLKTHPDLYRVVTLLVINAVTQDLYLSDRSRPRFVIFDEAWQFLGRAAMMAAVIAEGYRRARKYRGAFMVITQSITDLETFGDVGDVIKSNSAFKIFLESPNFEVAQSKGLIDYDDFTMSLLKSVKSAKPKYSELFLDTPFGAGVLRLAVNDYTYYIYTSEAAEIAEIEGLIKKHGMTYDEAIREMVRRHRTPKLSDRAC